MDSSCCQQQYLISGIINKTQTSDKVPAVVISWNDYLYTNPY
ncbi:hypothetical protein pb186bvf_014986 [Paramecium bursaria]